MKWIDINDFKENTEILLYFAANVRLLKTRVKFFSRKLFLKTLKRIIFLEKIAFFSENVKIEFFRTKMPFLNNNFFSSHWKTLLPPSSTYSSAAKIIRNLTSLSIKATIFMFSFAGSIFPVILPAVEHSHQTSNSNLKAHHSSYFRR